MSGHRAPGPAASRWLPWCMSVVLVVLALDQFTKVIVRAQLERGETWPEDWERIRVVHVTILGIFQDQTMWLTVVTFIASVWMAWMIYRVAAERRWYAFSLSLILGGALGNLVDRVRLGEVTDFIRPLASPIFNVADAAIAIGIVMAFILTLSDDGESSSHRDRDAQVLRRRSARQVHD